MIMMAPPSFAALQQNTVIWYLSGEINKVNQILHRAVTLAFSHRWSSRHVEPISSSYRRASEQQPMLASC